MDIITAQDARLLEWAQQRLQLTWPAESVRWLAGIRDGAISLVVVYSHFAPRDCQMNIATDGSKRWATKQSLRAMFEPPFIQWKLPRVSFVVRPDNQPSIRMLTKAGAKPEGRLRCAFEADVDGLLYGMLAAECKYLKLGAAVAHSLHTRSPDL